MLRSSGLLVIDPYSRAEQKRWWVVLRCCLDLAEYYRSRINWENRARFRVDAPIWPSHISLIRGEVPSFLDCWQLIPEVEFSFEYEPVVHTNGRHFWLPVSFPHGGEIRRSVGLDPDPPLEFHLTIGVCSARALEHSWILGSSFLNWSMMLEFPKPPYF